MNDRKLTQNEVALAQKIFGASIDYNKVALHRHAYVFFQPSSSGMTPNGEIYVDGTVSADYGLSVARLQAFFIHEMEHVWQKENGVLNPI